MHMNICDYLSEELVLLNLQGRDRKSLFQEMVQHLVKQKKLDDAPFVVQLLIEREKLSSTGMRGGVAIPHAYLPAMEKSLLMIGISHEGIDFDTLENDPVHVVFLLLGSDTERSAHIRILARLSRLMRNDSLRAHLLKTTSATEVLQAIDDNQ